MMRSGLAARAGVTAVLLLVVTSAAVGTLFYYGSRAALVETTLGKLNDQLREKRTRIELHVEQLRQDALMLADTAPVRGIVRAARAGGRDPLDGSTLDQWRARLADNFAAVLRAKPDYLKARVIGVADGAREIVTVQRGAAGPEVVPDAALQRKGDRYYVRDALQQPAHSVYVSRVDLNQEHGRIETPHQPVLRAAVPLHDNSGGLFGLLVITMDFDRVIDSVAGDDAPVDQRFFMTDADGYFLHHPDPARRFGKDLGTPYRMQDELPTFAPFFAATAATQPWAIYDAADRRSVGNFQRLSLDPSRPDRFIGIAFTLPYDAALAGVDAVRDRAVWLALLLIAVASALALWLARLLARDLTRITAAAESMAGIRDLPPAPLPVAAPGEIGVLARAFEAMQRQIEVRTAALNESNKRYRLLADHTSDMISLHDAATTYLYVSPASKTLLGYAPEELLGKRAFEFMHPEDAELLRQKHSEQSRNPEQVTLVYRLRHKDGHYVWVESAASPMCDPATGQLQGHIVARRDVTERKFAQESLRQNEQRLQAIFDNAMDAIITAGADGIIESANPAARRMLGYADTGLSGVPLAVLVGAGAAPHHDTYLNSYLSVGPTFAGSSTREVTARRRDGSEFPVELSITHLRLSGNDRFVGFVRDITARKQTEQQLLGYRDHLLQIVDIKTRELVTARDAAQAGERSMSGFLANMSHELRTPLHGVLSYARFGLKRFDTVPPEKLREYFAEIHASAEGLLLLVNDLLDLSKLHAGRMVYDYGNHDMVRLARTAIDELAPLSEEKNVAIELDARAPATDAHCDRNRILQVLRNLLSNAIKFTQPGTTISVTVTPETEGGARVDVTDRGVGIPAAETELIFDAFTQSSHTRHNGGGTGLGLAICKEIVESGHGGCITAANRPGGGAQFTFIIPARVIPADAAGRA